MTGLTHFDDQGQAQLSKAPDSPCTTKACAALNYHHSL